MNPTPFDVFFREFLPERADTPRERAALRRALSDPTVIDAQVILGGWLRNVPAKHHDLYLLVAALWATYPHITPLENSRYANLGTVAARIEHATGTPGARTRLETLKRTPMGPSFRAGLTGLVRLAASHNVSIPYPQVLSDLIHLNDPSRDVKRRWVKSYVSTLYREGTPA